MMDFKPVLYILMRNDLASMTNGKSSAQASHASNAFVYEWGEDLNVKKWQNETNQGFGTVIVLGVNESEMNNTINNALDRNFIANIIHDPTYPLIDGNVVHYIPLNTCGYIFGDKNDLTLKYILKDLYLHQ